jgi:C_GCAxxG_C_C family probable redox protein
MSKKDDAVKCFDSGFNCAQSVFTVFCEDLGLNKETALKISSSFGGGMGHNGETCGAVTGAFMALGLKYGRFKVEDIEASDKTYDSMSQFVNKFKEKYGSLNCSQLLGADMTKPEERARVRETNLTRTVCPKLVSEAAELVEALLKA